MTASSRPPRHRRDRRVGRAVTTIAVVAAAVAAWQVMDGRLDDLFAAAPQPAVTATPASAPPRPDDAFALTVEHVFDGDTVEVRIAVPNDVVPTTNPVRVRLIGIDTPEGTPSAQCWADEAREHLRTLLPAGSTVWAAPDTEWRDRYDRALLYLWTEDGRFVNHELMVAGDAEALLIEPNGAHFALFSAAEVSARAEGVGRWGACG